MKKFFTRMLAFILVLFCSISLVACGPNQEGQNNTSGQGNNNGNQNNQLNKSVEVEKVVEAFDLIKGYSFDGNILMSGIVKYDNFDIDADLDVDIEGYVYEDEENDIVVYFELSGGLDLTESPIGEGEYFNKIKVYLRHGCLNYVIGEVADTLDGVVYGDWASIEIEELMKYIPNLLSGAWFTDYVEENYMDFADIDENENNEIDELNEFEDEYNDEFEDEYNDEFEDEYNDEYENEITEISTGMYIMQIIEDIAAQYFNDFTAELEQMTKTEIGKFVLEKLLNLNLLNVKVENQNIIYFNAIDFADEAENILNILIENTREAESLYKTINQLVYAVKDELGIKYQGNFVDYVFSNISSFLYTEDGDSQTVKGFIQKVDEFLQENFDITVKDIVDNVINKFMGNPGDESQEISYYDMYMEMELFGQTKLKDMELADLFDMVIQMAGIELPSFVNYYSLITMAEAFLQGITMDSIIPEEVIEQLEKIKISEMQYNIELKTDLNGELKGFEFNVRYDVSYENNEVEYQCLNNCSVVLNIQKLQNKSELKQMQI